MRAITVAFNGKIKEGNVKLYKITSIYYQIVIELIFKNERKKSNFKEIFILIKIS